MKKLVVFDWNGVIIADTIACMDADNHVLKTFGEKPIDHKTYLATFTVPVIDFYLVNGVDIKKLKRNQVKWENLFYEYYEKRAAKVRTRKNLRKLLEWFKKKGFELIILSNHTVDDIENQLKRLKIKQYFSLVLANSNGMTAFKKRNKLQKLQSYLKKGNYDKNNVIIIGDSPEEIEVGHKLGIKKIAITGGYYSTKRLRESKPDFLVNNLKEIMAVLK